MPVITVLNELDSDHILVWMDLGPVRDSPPIESKKVNWLQFKAILEANHRGVRTITHRGQIGEEVEALTSYWGSFSLPAASL